MSSTHLLVTDVSHLPSKQLPTVRVKPVSITAPRRVIRVTPLQPTNPRSILIPVNGVSGVRTIKIINAGSKTQSNINARAKQMLTNSSAVITTIDDDKEDSDSSDTESVYPRLQLTGNSFFIFCYKRISGDIWWTFYQILLGGISSLSSIHHGLFVIT